MVTASSAVSTSQIGDSWTLRRRASASNTRAPRPPGRRRAASPLPGRVERQLDAELDDQRGDVVAAAAAQRQVDKLGGGVGGVLGAGHHLLNRLVRREPVQPVGAEQDAVARLDLDVGHVDARVAAAAQVARQDRLVRVDRRLAAGQRPAREELGHHRVIAGEQAQPAAAQQVGPAVADVGHQRAALAGQAAGDHRRAHAGQIAILLGAGVHGGRRGAHRSLELRRPAPSSRRAASRG